MLVNLKEALAYAEEKGCAVGMFNGTGLDSVQAIIGAAEELGQPVILGHAEVHNRYNDISLVGPLLLAAARNAKVPVCVHLDHGVSMQMIDRALALGFTSVMVDASALPFEENVAFTRTVCEKAHAQGCSVEAELGRLPTAEGCEGAETSVKCAEDYYTDADEAERFVARTGIDALAVAFGTSHGFYKAPPKLDFGVVERARKAGVPLVMHGGSGVSDEDFRSAIRAGIRKINYYSYMSKAGCDAARALLLESGTSYLHEVEYAAMLAMKENVKKAIEVFSMKGAKA